MGEFATKVRKNKIPGPNSRGFNRSDWEAALESSTADDADRHLAVAGLFYAEILNFLRGEIHLQRIGLTRSLIIRIAVGAANLKFAALSAHGLSSFKQDGEPPKASLPELMAHRHPSRDGQQFLPDELLTGLGDGLRHLVKELQYEGNSHNVDNTEIRQEIVDLIQSEIDKAIVYECAVDDWLDCLGNGYILTEGSGFINLEPSDQNLEIARTASSYRRLNHELQTTLLFADTWYSKLRKQEKLRLVGIKLAAKIHGGDNIVRIELANTNAALGGHLHALASKLWLEQSYYKNLLNDPLPKLHGVSLSELIDGWRFLQSLSFVLADTQAKLWTKGRHRELQYAPQIQPAVLVASLSKSLLIDHDKAAKIADALTFTGAGNQDLWTRPLVRCGGQLLLVVPCIVAVHLMRIVEGWMREGGLDLGRRGKEFEQYCRDFLAYFLRKSPIRLDVLIAPVSITFKPKGREREEVDLIMIVGGTILVIEAKCILWPDNSIEFANYRDTIDGAVAQVSRKRNAIVENMSEFLNSLRSRGINPPDEPDVVCCVLTNSAAYAGFPIDGIPVVDLAILADFLCNENIRFEERHYGQPTRQSKLRFYRDAREAGEVLEAYLTFPPQLELLKESIRWRSVTFPVASEVYGSIIKRIFEVQLHSAAADGYSDELYLSFNRS